MAFRGCEEVWGSQTSATAAMQASDKRAERPTTRSAGSAQNDAAARRESEPKCARQRRRSWTCEHTSTRTRERMRASPCHDMHSTAGEDGGPPGRLTRTGRGDTRRDFAPKMPSPHFLKALRLITIVPANLTIHSGVVFGMGLSCSGRHCVDAMPDPAMMGFGVKCLGKTSGLITQGLRFRLLYLVGICP